MTLRLGDFALSIMSTDMNGGYEARPASAPILLYLSSQISGECLMTLMYSVPSYGQKPTSEDWTGDVKSFIFCSADTHNHSQTPALLYTGPDGKHRDRASRFECPFNVVEMLLNIPE